MLRARVILLATPVYWYTMSAQTKTFVDRLPDLITIRKDVGRALAGREIYLLATSTTEALPPGSRSS